MAASLIDTPTADTHATLSDAELRALDAFCRAANYLSVGQVYLVGPTHVGSGQGQAATSRNGTHN